MKNGMKGDNHNRHGLCRCEQKNDDDVCQSAKNVSPHRRVEPGLEITHTVNHGLQLILVNLA